MIQTLLQHLLPQHFLSRVMFTLARWRWRPWKNTLIRFFIRRYRVDMGIAERATAAEFRDFNDFFTRALKADARPVDQEPTALVSPVDGVISALGRIDGETLYQAKGRHYSLPALLAGDRGMVERYRGGDFMTLYLSPRDYHRIHMPADGSPENMIYVPGSLFSVNALSTRRVNALFARNERVICDFNTAAGNLALVLVGAIFVGGLETVWQGPITPRRKRRIQHWHYPPASAPALAKGAEMGRFNMGSTVILLTVKNGVNWSGDLRPDRRLAMGSRIGRRRL